MEEKLDIYDELRELLRVGSSMLADLEPIMSTLQRKLKEAEKRPKTSDVAYVVGCIKTSVASTAVVVDQLKYEASEGIRLLYIERALRDPNLGVRHEGGGGNAESTEE